MTEAEYKLETRLWKALKDDREKCISAGASDYLPKPIDTDRLVAVMRMWLRG